MQSGFKAAIRARWRVDASARRRFVVRPRENRDAGGIAVEEVPATDGADFALGKETGDRDGTNAFLHDRAVMMSVTKEPFTAAATTE